MSRETICLITPPSVFLLDERVFVSLGILKVAAVLEKRGYSLEMVDLSGIENYTVPISDHAKKTQAKIFGITATTPQLPAAVQIAEAIKRVRPDAKIIIGGPHATLVNAAYKREKKNGVSGRAVRAMQELKNLFDIIIAGDGEEAIFHALNSDTKVLVDSDANELLENTPLIQIAGKPRSVIVDADERSSSMFLTNNRLNELPFPARHLVDMESYHYSIDGVRATSLIAQLGCPFECGFCGGRMSPMLRKTRMRTSENIVAEILEIHHRYGLKGFMFYDDELNVNKKVVELMELITKVQRDLHTEFRLRGFVKAELFNEEQARAMYEAGFRWLLVGFESGSPRILENINKKATQEENTRCLKIARRYGLKVKALMSIGHPGESHDTIQETFEWLLKVKPDDFDMTIITCYPGTPYYDEAVETDQSGMWVYTYEKTGDRLFQVELDYTKTPDYYKGRPDGGYQAYVYTDFISSEDLVRERDRMERTLREILKIPFNSSAPARRYEHSMGQSGGAYIPPHILRTSIP